MKISNAYVTIPIQFYNAVWTLLYTKNWQKYLSIWIYCNKIISFYQQLYSFVMFNWFFQSQNNDALKQVDLLISSIYILCMEKQKNQKSGKRC